MCGRSRTHKLISIKPCVCEGFLQGILYNIEAGKARGGMQNKNCNKRKHLASAVFESGI